MNTIPHKALHAAIALLFFIGTATSAHVHFIHQSTGENWLNDYDEWDPGWASETGVRD